MSNPSPETSGVPQGPAPSHQGFPQPAPTAWQPPQSAWPAQTGWPSQQTAPQASQPGFVEAPAPPQALTGAAPVAPPPRPRRWAARLVGGAAVVALGLGSGAGGAYLVTSHGTSSAVTTVTRVVQGSTSAPDWAATAAAVIPSTVSIEVTSRSGSGEGSGVIWDTAGHIVTNNHVVAALGSSAVFTVRLADGRTLPATVVSTDPAHDLAVLRLTTPPADLTPIPLGDDTSLRVGDPVMAVGNPLGLSETVTTGIVSALARDVPTSESARGATQTTTSAIQVSAPINPGNSGGALVDAEGRLVGINFSIAALSANSGSIGIGFAIPVTEVSAVVSGLIVASR